MQTEAKVITRKDLTSTGILTIRAIAMVSSAAIRKDTNAMAAAVTTTAGVTAAYGYPGKNFRCTAVYERPRL